MPLTDVWQVYQYQFQAKDLTAWNKIELQARGPNGNRVDRRLQAHQRRELGPGPTPRTLAAPTGSNNATVIVCDLAGKTVRTLHGHASGAERRRPDTAPASGLRAGRCGLPIADHDHFVSIGGLHE